jgi:hypothetical protein
LQVEERAARVAAVDGGVRLDEVVVVALADVAAARGDDAGGDAAAEAERVADRHHPVAHLRVVGVAELHRVQRLVGLDAQHREVRARVRPQQLGADGGVVLEDDVDLVRARR